MWQSQANGYLFTKKKHFNLQISKFYQYLNIVQLKSLLQEKNSSKQLSPVFQENESDAFFYISILFI